MRRRILHSIAQLALCASLGACAAEVDSLSDDLEASQTADGLLDAPVQPDEVIELGQEQARTCPGRGRITYTLQRAAVPSEAQRSAYTKIRAAMDKAVSNYNCYTDISRALTVRTTPRSPRRRNIRATTLRRGVHVRVHPRDARDCPHAGCGHRSALAIAPSDGRFSGGSDRAASQHHRQAGRVLHADRQHFWPYGFNYASEVKSEVDVMAHCRLVTALAAISACSSAASTPDVCRRQASGPCRRQALGAVASCLPDKSTAQPSVCRLCQDGSLSLQTLPWSGSQRPRLRSLLCAELLVAHLRSSFF